jgi:hypothetical protein
LSAPGNVADPPCADYAESAAPASARSRQAPGFTPGGHQLSGQQGWRCDVFFVHDVGLGIDLHAAESLLRDRFGEAAQLEYRIIPELNFRQPPLRVALCAAARECAGFTTSGTILVTFYEFGAVSVRYPLDCADLDGLLALSVALRGDDALIRDSRRRLEELLGAMAPAVNRPGLATMVEDYVVFQPPAGAGPPGEFLARDGRRLAQLLRAEPARLSEEEIRDALSGRIAYREDELAVIDWNGAVVFGHENEQALAMLEFANVSLLELRWLDDQLDRLIDRSYERVGRHDPERRLRRGFPLIPDREARRVAAFQIDSTLLFEAVSNALKLIRDPYLARLYRLAAQRLHLREWDDGIRRKLQVLDGIYQKLADRAATRRLEVLEWIIIVLIAVSIVPIFW